jgi:hypothetical protein
MIKEEALLNSRENWIGKKAMLEGYDKILRRKRIVLHSHLIIGWSWKC